MARNAFYSLDFFNFFSLSNAKNLSACAQGIPNSAPNCSNIEAVPVTVALFSRDKGRSKNSLFPWNGNSRSRSGVSNLYSFTVCATLKLHPFNHASHYFSSMLSNRLFAVGIWLRATFKRFKKISVLHFFPYTRMVFICLYSASSPNFSEVAFWRLSFVKWSPLEKFWSPKIKAFLKQDTLCCLT